MKSFHILSHRLLLSPLLLLAALTLDGCGARAPSTSLGQGTSVTAAATPEDASLHELVAVRERLRLSADLYGRFAQRHADPTFRLVRQSKEEQIDAVGRLLRNRGVDPRVVARPSDTTTAVYRAEIDPLVAEGAGNPTDALRACARREQRDIEVLREKRAETAGGDLTRLYAGLERLGRGHVYRFAARLRVLGEPWRPETTETADVR